MAEFRSGYVVLADNQYYAGYTIFLAKRCVPELHELAGDERSLFLDEMATVAEAVWRAFTPRKLNYELLGNGVPHLHWHIIPRYAGDAMPEWPAWSNPAFIDSPRVTSIEPEVLRERRERLRAVLTALTALEQG